MGSTNESAAANGLIAVLFITRSRPGPRLNFHYPARPQWPIPVKSRKERNANSGSDSESDLAADEALQHKSTKDTVPSPEPPVEVFQPAAGLESGSLASKVDTTPARLLGYSVENLERLLAPGKWSDRKKFEVCLDGLTLLGHPVYAGQDGKWSADGKDSQVIDKHPGHALPETVDEENEDGDSTEMDNDVDAQEEYQGTTTTAKITITAPEDAKSSHDFTHIPESLDSQNGVSLATSLNSASTTSGVIHDRMTMFHVVFVVAANKAKATADLYRHVARKLGKALYYCQKQTNYVSTESRTIMTLKMKAKIERLSTDALYAQMLETSQLAWALKEVFDSISVGRIASIRLDGSEISLQIPLPGTESHLDGESVLGAHSGILLLEDKETLLRELTTGDTSPLAFFIREHTPTKTLQKHAVNLGLPVADLLYLARHLIKWRKAKAITPLNQRNYYVVSPEAPIQRVYDLMPEYATRFAALPSLPQMLKILSGKPIKYVMLMPSRDHRGPYMSILAYLVRHGFVVQLKTFAWLQCPKDLRNSVAATPRKAATPKSLLSPHLRAMDDDTASVNSDRTAIPHAILSERFKSRSRRSSTGTQETAVKDSPAGAVSGPLIIVNPGSPTHVESDAIDRIQVAISDEEVQRLVPSILPYLDGEKVLEELAPREGLKRSHVERALEVLEREGFLLTFRRI
ncbi:nitrogen permease regulator 3 [Acrodontium crateriforme]|uniref:Nitrogen permease regulator 3 n=1 Tax=Acrodontium crateriforme TaxID=150365 RepID=A0AAQ3M1J2_9PEZI|nr:nitrogen permease regulator 3 [Acrodontium crateriforme]